MLIAHIFAILETRKNNFIYIISNYHMLKRSNKICSSVYYFIKEPAIIKGTLELRYSA